MKHKILASAAAGAAALTTLGLGAGAAQAAPAGIPDGLYTFHSPGYFGAVNHDRAAVTHNGHKLAVRYGAMVKEYPLAKTPNGAVYDDHVGTRITLRKTGPGRYAGAIWHYGLHGGKVSLTKR